MSNVISNSIEIKTNEVVNINKCHKKDLIRGKFILQGRGEFNLSEPLSLRTFVILIAEENPWA